MYAFAYACVQINTNELKMYANTHIFFKNMLKLIIIYDICIFKSKKNPHS